MHLSQKRELKSSLYSEIPSLFLFYLKSSSVTGTFNRKSELYSQRHVHMVVIHVLCETSILQNPSYAILWMKSVVCFGPDLNPPSNMLKGSYIVCSVLSALKIKIALNLVCILLNYSIMKELLVEVWNYVSWGHEECVAQWDTHLN